MRMTHMYLPLSTLAMFDELIHFFIAVYIFISHN